MARRNLFTHLRRRDILDRDGKTIGRIGERTITMHGQMPEIHLQSMVGRRLREVIQRVDIARDVRIVRAENVASDRWGIYLSGRALLPEDIAQKREREAGKAASTPHPAR